MGVQVPLTWNLEEQRYREAYLNAKLAQRCTELEANPWAALDFSGIEFPPDACAKYMLLYQQVCVHASALHTEML